MFGEIIAVIGSFVVPSTIDPSLLQLFGTMDDLIAAGDKKWGYEPAWRAIERGAIVEAEAGAASSGNTMSVEMLPDLIIVTGSEGSGTTMVHSQLLGLLIKKSIPPMFSRHCFSGNSYAVSIFRYLWWRRKLDVNVSGYKFDRV